MTEQKEPNEKTDERTPVTDGLALDRRTALKGGAAGLTALGMGGFMTTSAVADPDGGDGANQIQVAGATWDHFEGVATSDGAAAEVVDLLRIDGVKQSNSWQDSLVFNPSLETSLLTDAKLKGGADESETFAGVLGWVEIRDSDGGDWQMVTLDDELRKPPGEDDLADLLTFDEEIDLADPDGIPELAQGAVAFNARALELEWDLTAIMEAIEDGTDETVEEEELFLDIYLRTRSANTFNFVKTDTGGTHDVRVRGGLYAHVDEDSKAEVEAHAIVGNRSLVVQPMKIK
jgi:hypothetical protein